MAIKRFKPKTAGTRQMSVSTYDELTEGAKAEKSLIESLGRSGGRNATGRITVRHIGGGNRQKYRIIDFKRDKDNVPAIVRRTLRFLYTQTVKRDIFSRLSDLRKEMWSRAERTRILKSVTHCLLQIFP